MTPDTPSPHPGSVDDRIRTEAESAKAEARHAADGLRDTASDLSGKARQKAWDESEKGKEQIASGLDDFAAAVRKASEELGTRDQSMASGLVREVAGGLEHASRTIHGKDVGQLTRSVAQFARERPATFLVGAALAGLALGRFARSSGEHTERAYAAENPSSGRRHRTDDRDRTPSPIGDTVPPGYRSSFTDQPRPTEGAFPADRDPVTGAVRRQGDPDTHPPSGTGKPSAGAPSTSNGTHTLGGQDGR